MHGRVKRRSRKADGISKGLDMCPTCFAFGCDPFAMSPQFREKITRRLRQKRCPCCGKPKGFCSCKSSMDLNPGTHTIRTHNNKKLRKAERENKAKETAWLIWRKNFEQIALILGEEQAAEIDLSLRNHNVPQTRWSVVVKALNCTETDLQQLWAGWKE